MTEFQCGAIVGASGTGKTETAKVGTAVGECVVGLLREERLNVFLFPDDVVGSCSHDGTVFYQLKLYTKHGLWTGCQDLHRSCTSKLYENYIL